MKFSMCAPPPVCLAVSRSRRAFLLYGIEFILSSTFLTFFEVLFLRSKRQSPIQGLFACRPRRSAVRRLCYGTKPRPPCQAPFSLFLMFVFSDAFTALSCLFHRIRNDTRRCRFPVYSWFDFDPMARPAFGRSYATVASIAAFRSSSLWARMCWYSSSVISSMEIPVMP